MQPPRRPERPPATLSDVRDGVEKLIRDVATLRTMTTELGRSVSEHVAPGTHIWEPAYWSKYAPPSDTTNAPTNPIREALAELEKVNDVESMARTLKAAARGVDGALMDIRAMRLNLQSIADDASATESFTRKGRGTRNPGQPPRGPGRR